MARDSAMEMRIAEAKVLESPKKLLYMLPPTVVLFILGMYFKEIKCVCDWENKINLCLMDYHQGMCLVAYKKIVPEYKFPDDVNCYQHIIDCKSKNSELYTCSVPYTTVISFMLLFSMSHFMNFMEETALPWLYKKEITLEFERRCVDPSDQATEEDSKKEK